MKYIGIDIGDGESAVTVVSENGSILPTVVPLGNVKSIRSVVGTLAGKPVIGDSAVLNHAATNRSARFKSRFLYEAEAEQDLQRFASGLRELVEKSVNDTNLRIALGCPAEWNPADRNRYAAIVQSAGFSNLYTVSESRAAFLYAHYSNELNLSEENLKQPTLVIDIGSSTLDYAYIVDGRERDVGVFGDKHLGGGILDGLILEHAVEASAERDQIQEIFSCSPSWKNYCELIARNLKEEYFLSEDRLAVEGCSTIAPIYADLGNPKTLKISLSGEIMENLLNQKLAELENQSFLEAIRNSLQLAKNKTSKHPVKLMIVTGGASRMKFFQEMCKEIFPDAQMALCEEPEFSIARGLGIAARTDDMLLKFRKKIEGYFESGAIESEVKAQLPHLLPDYVPAVSKVLQKNAIAQAVAGFQGNASDTAQVETYLNDKIGTVLQDPKLMREADEILGEWIVSRLTRVQEKLDQFCDEYQIARADMSLLKIHTDVKIPEFKVPLLLRIMVAAKRLPFMGTVFAELTKRGFVMTNRKQKQLNDWLADPNGEFANVLGEKLVMELQRQIAEQVRKVEIQIT